MQLRSRLSIASFVLAMIPGVALAQNPIDYATGEYQFADEQSEVDQIEGTAEPGEESVATRAIPSRLDGTVIFVSEPVVQTNPSVEPDDYACAASEVETAMEYGGTVPGWPPPEGTRPHQDPAVHRIVRRVEYATVPEGSVFYTYPANYGHPAAPGGASRVIHRSSRAAAGQYIYIYQGDEPVVLPGGRLVQFDRTAWLAECSRRLSPEVGEEDVSATVDASYEARATCEDYLDSYMENARSGAFHARYSDSGQYMLVPVMIMVPQRAVYREGTAVDQ